MGMQKILARVLGVAALFLVSISPAADQGKTTLCHKPDKNGGNTITVSDAAVQKHLDNHGDYIGACPTPFDDNGGTIELAGDVSVVIPPGALETSVDISVRRLNNSDGNVGSFFAFEPSGTQFLLPIEVRISYDRAQLPPGVTEDELFTAIGIEHGFDPIDGSFVDSSTSEVVATIDHFTDIGIDFPYESCGDETVVLESDFEDVIASSFEMPIGDPESDVSLLELGPPDSVYPLISYNENGSTDNRWYVATAFDQNTWLHQGWDNPLTYVPDFYCVTIAACSVTNNQTHPGEDWNIIDDPEGDREKPVKAIADGIVLYSGVKDGYSVAIAHRLPDGSYVASYYAHLLEDPRDFLCKGKKVRKGDPIGHVGDSSTVGAKAETYRSVEVGGLSPHLHFEIGKGIDAMLYRDPTTHEIDLAGKSNGLNHVWYGGYYNAPSISELKLDPSKFIKAHAAPPLNGRFVEGRATGTVFLVNERNGAEVPGNIAVGDTVNISFLYDIDSAQIRGETDNATYYEFPDGRPSGLDVTIQGLTWSTGNNLYANVINNASSNSLDQFSLYGIGVDDFQSFPGAVSEEGAVEFRMDDWGSPFLLSTTHLPQTIDDLDLSSLSVNSFFGSVYSGYTRGLPDPLWEVNFYLDTDSFVLESSDEPTGSALLLDSPPVGLAAYGVSSCQVVAQQFQISSTSAIEELKLYLARQDTPPGTFEIHITDSINADITAANILLEKPVNVSPDISADNQSPTAVSVLTDDLILDPGNYYLVLEAPTAGIVVNWVDGSNTELPSALGGCVARPEAIPFPPGDPFAFGNTINRPMAFQILGRAL